MMNRIRTAAWCWAVCGCLWSVSGFGVLAVGDEPRGNPALKPVWSQWRGPTRDGQLSSPQWPDRLEQGAIEKVWSQRLGPSYSGPVVTAERVFTTETKDQTYEAAIAYDRDSGKLIWRAEWKGAMTVPFFAWANGSWIRSTPVCDGDALFVAGMRDVLVCLDAATGIERWRIDFVSEYKSPLPAFGFVSSPLLDGDHLYVQAGAGVVKLHKQTGKVAWRVLQDAGGMYGSAFSSPVLAELAGRRQLLVQTREKLAGLDPDTGDVLWSQKVAAFRGMNILTPVVFGDAVFTSTYQNKSWLFRVTREQNDYRVSEAWSNNAQGYMSTPVVIDGHAYLHLQNQRFTCIDLATGTRTWTSQTYGKYASLVAQGNRILALESNGRLLEIEANPRAFKLSGEAKLTTADTWAHLAIADDELVIREQEALSVFRWKRKAASRAP